MTRAALSLNAISVEDWPLWRELRIEALREASHAFGARLSDWQGPGDTEQRWRERLASVPLNIVAHFDGKPAGMVSALSPDADTAELISMWVAPFARGRGVGNALIHSVIAWAKEKHATRVLLAVRNDNRPAIALYSRHGFIDSGPNLADGQPEERVMTVSLSYD